MMMVVVREGNHYVIIHAGRVVDQSFDSMDEAESWADSNIDDQMFDGPNWFSEPLKYRDAPLMQVVGQPREAR
jgi:hypothetical protein